MNKVYIFLIVIITIFLSGCVTKRYAWNNYDDTLYQYYKNPNEAEVFIEKLDAIIKNGEASGLCRLEYMLSMDIHFMKEASIQMQLFISRKNMINGQNQGHS